MKPCSVVLLEQDARIARALVLSLQNHFDTIRVATSCVDLREEVAKQRATLVILDIESACFGEIQKLREEFPHLAIVCTHRLADEQMWADVLDAGASDLCGAFDLASIVRSAVGQMQHVQSAAA
jgi:DNA-binding response OmpR family regulator